MLLPMQDQFVLPGLVQTLSSPLSGLSQPAQDMSAAAATSAGPSTASAPHERQSEHEARLSVEDPQLVDGQDPSLLPVQNHAQQQEAHKQEPAAAPAEDAVLSQQTHTVDTPQSPPSATHAAHVLAGLVSPDPEASGHEANGTDARSSPMPSSAGLKQHNGQDGEHAADAVLSQQADTLDAPQSPASATHAAHVLAGLVSPEPAHGHQANGTGTSSRADPPSHCLKQEIVPGVWPEMPHAVRRSPAGPGQSRLDQLLGIAPSAENGTAGDQLEQTSHAQPDSAVNPVQVPDMDEHGDAKAAGGPVQLEPRSIVDDKRLEVAEQHEGRSAGRRLEAGHSLPENAPPEQLPPLLSPERGSSADMPIKGRSDKSGASPTQASLSMAAAGSFCNFTIAAGGLAQWRYLLSGEQVRCAAAKQALLWKPLWIQEEIVSQTHQSHQTLIWLLRA